MLSEAEKEIILTGWAQAMKDSKGLGADIFITLFAMFPQHQELFKDFKGKSLEELRQFSKLKAHGLRVVKTLDGAIQCLDDMDVCVSSLELIGETHKGRNMSISHFEDLNKVLPDVFERRMGKQFTEHKDVWMKLLQGIIPVIQRGM